MTTQDGNDNANHVKELAELMPEWIKPVHADAFRVSEEHLEEFLEFCYDWDVRPGVNQLVVLLNEPQQRRSPCADVDIYIGIGETDESGVDIVWYEFDRVMVDCYLAVADGEDDAEDDEDFDDAEDDEDFDDVDYLGDFIEDEDY